MRFLVTLSNLVKVGGLKLADFINYKKEPFDDFTRAIEPKYEEPLHTKAARFKQNMLDNFGLYGNKIWNYKKHPSGWIDAGDQCIWHGVYTAMWALQYSVTKTDTDLEILRKCMEGLLMHQTIHGEERPRLVRGMRPLSDAEKANPPHYDNEHQKFIIKGDWLIEDSCSNDSACGHILGIYFAWLYGDEDIKQKASLLAQGLANELIDHKYKLVLQDGTPTPHGKLINGILTDPMGLGLCLTILKVAYVSSGIKKYNDHYLSVEKKYNGAGLVRFGKASLLSWGNAFDIHRAAIILSILADLEHENDHLCAEYMDGLKRVWDTTQKHRNVWVAFLYARHFKLTDKEKQDCLGRLSEFSVEDKFIVKEAINSKDEEYWTARGVRFFIWGKRKRLHASQPLPIWKIGSQDFHWQRNLFAVDQWIGHHGADTFHNGGDFLITYWLGRHLSLISTND